MTIETNPTQKSIADEIREVQVLLKTAQQAVAKLMESPALIRVADFGMLLENFTSGKPANTKVTRKRRTPAEIEADKAAGK